MNRNELQSLLNLAACCEIDRRQRQDQEEETLKQKKKKKQEEQDAIRPIQVQSSQHDAPDTKTSKRKTLIIPGAVP